jgi:hypothetical protein
MPSSETPLYLGVFLNEADVLAAARAARTAGYHIHDAYAPYAVHGLDQAIGLRPSRLPWVTLAAAVTGLVAAGLGQYWMTAIDWPLNVGGKPFNSLPAFLPAMFETMVLLAGIGTVVALLLRAGLHPGREAWLAHERVTDDRFVLAVAAESHEFDARPLDALWAQCGVAEARVATFPGARAAQ